jgi:hypothetical protein
VQFGRVVKRLRDKDGLPIGTANDNPILDTRMYEVEFQDGYRASLAANAITENLFAQLMMKGIGMYSFKKSSTIGPTVNRFSNRTPSSRRKWGLRGEGRQLLDGNYVCDGKTLAQPGSH